MSKKLLLIKILFKINFSLCELFCKTFYNSFKIIYKNKSFEEIAATCSKSYLQNDPHNDLRRMFTEAVSSNYSPRQSSLYLSISKILSFKKKITVLELGGGGGEHYYSIKNNLGDEIIEKYIIWEIPFFKDKIAPLHNDNKIKYIVTDELKHYDFPKIDIAYISGTLQYLQDYQSYLKMITDIQPNFVLINRTPFWNFKTTAIKQFMGGNSNATNAAWIFNEKDIDDLMQSQYKKLPLTFGVHDNPIVIPYGHYPYKSFIYELIS